MNDEHALVIFLCLSIIIWMNNEHRKGLQYITMKLPPFNYFTDSLYSSYFHIVVYAFYRPQIATTHSSYVFCALLASFLIWFLLSTFFPISSTVSPCWDSQPSWYWAFDNSSFRYEFYVTEDSLHVSSVYTSQAQN